MSITITCDAHLLTNVKSPFSRKLLLLCQNFRTINAEANEKVAFMRLNGLTLEIYENRSAVMSYGAVDHIALNVTSVDEAFEFVNESGLNNTKDSIHFLPFWENGVKFFTIEGPNK